MRRVLIVLATSGLLVCSSCMSWFDGILPSGGHADELTPGD